MTNRPPFETFKGPWCRGSVALGTACGSCEKCAWERDVTQNTQALPSVTSGTRSDRIAEIRQLRAGITPGPWQVVRQARSLSEAGKRAMPHLVPPDALGIATVASDPQLGDVWPVVTLAESGFFEPSCRIAIEDADARFIAQAPQIVDDLLAELAASTQRVLELEEEKAKREHQETRP